MTERCPNCGTAVDVAATRCPACGLPRDLPVYDADGTLLRTTFRESAAPILLAEALAANGPRRRRHLLFAGLSAAGAVILGIVTAIVINAAAVPPVDQAGGGITASPAAVTGFTWSPTPTPSPTQTPTPTPTPKATPTPTPSASSTAPPPPTSSRPTTSPRATSQPTTRSSPSTRPTTRPTSKPPSTAPTSGLSGCEGAANTTLHDITASTDGSMTAGPSGLRGPWPVTLRESGSRVVHIGGGALVTADTRILMVQYQLIDGTTGALVSAGQSLMTMELYPLFAQQLINKRYGSRVLIGLTSTDLHCGRDPIGPRKDKLPSGHTALVLLDIVAT